MEPSFLLRKTQKLFLGIKTYLNFINSILSPSYPFQIVGQQICANTSETLFIIHIRSTKLFIKKTAQEILSCEETIIENLSPSDIKKISSAFSKDITLPKFYIASEEPYEGETLFTISSKDKKYIKRLKASEAILKKHWLTKLSSEEITRIAFAAAQDIAAKEKEELQTSKRKIIRQITLKTTSSGENDS